MRLLGRDIEVGSVMDEVRARLVARGLSARPGTGAVDEAVEAPVDPLAFNLAALDEHADPTRGLPLETHRDGLSGRAVVLAKTLFRRVGQVLINEALGRQRLFNGHVRDSYAQLSAEVVLLKGQVERLTAELEAQRAPPPPPAVAETTNPPKSPAKKQRRT